jgi:hypothetical protein
VTIDYLSIQVFRIAGYKKRERFEGGRKDEKELVVMVVGATGVWVDD